MTPVGTPNPSVMKCHPTYYYCTLIRNISIIIWLQPKRCNSFNFPLIRGLIEKKQIADFAYVRAVGTPNPFVMKCHPTYYYCTLIRNISIIIWLQPKRCNSFNFPLIRGLIEKKQIADFAYVRVLGTPNPFVME